MPYVDGYHRYASESAFFDLAKSERLTHHVVLTTGSALLKTIIGAEAQKLAERHCNGMVIGASETIMGGHCHVHVLASRRDARKLKDAWVAAGYGRVEVSRPDADDKHGYRLMVRYVHRKWNRDGYGVEHMVYVAPKAA